MILNPLPGYESFFQLRSGGSTSSLLDSLCMWKLYALLDIISGDREMLAAKAKTCHMQPDFLLPLLAYDTLQLTNGKLQQKTEEDKTNMCKPLLSSLTISSRSLPHYTPKVSIGPGAYYPPVCLATRSSPHRSTISFKVAQQDFEPVVVMTWPKSS